MTLNTRGSSIVFHRFDSTPNFDLRVLFGKIFQQGFLNLVTACHLQVLEAGQILWYRSQDTSTQPKKMKL
jgi:hypothetical protein